MAEIQKADPQARRRSLLIALPGALLGALLLWLLVYFKPRLQGLFIAHGDTLIDHPIWVGLAMLVLMSPVMVMAGYFWWQGSRVVHSRRYPPPGMAVTRDTPVLREGAAVRRGRTVQTAAVVLVLASVGLCVMMALLIGSLA